jgi:hypothetical protein
LLTIFGTAESRRTIRSTLRPRSEFVLTARAYQQHPVTLYSYLLPLSMLFTGVMKPEFPEISPEVAGHVLTLLKVALYWLFAWLTLGHAAWFAMNRGLPFFLVPMGHWLAAVLVSQGVSYLVVPGFEWSSLRVLRQAAFTLPATLVTVYALSPLLRDRLGEIPELVPIWRFGGAVSDPLLLRLPAGKRGRVRRIHAANQYVEVVTEQGLSLLRMTLRDAAALMPADRGWLCHRSLWISRHEVVELTYVRGQPQILDRDGESWPISRAVAPKIRDWLQGRGTAADEGRDRAFL